MRTGGGVTRGLSDENFRSNHYLIKTRKPHDADLHHCSLPSSCRRKAGVPREIMSASLRLRTCRWCSQPSIAAEHLVVDLVWDFCRICSMLVLQDNRQTRAEVERERRRKVQTGMKGSGRAFLCGHSVAFYAVVTNGIKGLTAWHEWGRLILHPWVPTT
jgi:hypothetical protein